jgi:hypothetical protein
MGWTEMLEGKDSAKAAKRVGTGLRTFSEDGEPHVVKTAMLREALVRMHKSSRFFDVREGEDMMGWETEHGKIEAME